MNLNMQTLIDSYAHWLYVSGASADTIRHRTQTVKRLQVAGIDPLECSPMELIGWLAGFRNAATRHAYRAAIRTFYRWAVEFGQVEVDPSVKVPRVKVPRGTPHPISDAGLALLLASAHRQDLPLIQLMAYCGLRGNEAANVRPEDFGQRGGRWWLRITAPKGGGEQVVPVPSWLAGVRQHFPIGVSANRAICRVSAAIKAVEPSATPHSLRHWYATTALRQSGNVRIVQELLRHKSLSSTQIYTQVAESDVSAVAEGLPHVA